MHDIQLKKITESDHRFLYTLLRERNPKANISHKKMPTYEEHKKFVMSKPYSRWYIIKYENKSAGSVYLTKQNEIGIFIKKEFQNKGIGKVALQLLIEKNPRSRYLANVSPKNLKSIEFFEKNGFNLIQYTYEMINSDTH
jgi:RimJ/RimL family protein N-acetyltransferase